MTDLLQRAFDEASKLSENEQDELAQMLLQELKSEKRWTRLFAGSADKLGDLADEALEEHRKGETQDLEPEKL